jgi:hypothetical protein
MVKQLINVHLFTLAASVEAEPLPIAAGVVTARSPA